MSEEEPDHDFMRVSNSWFHWNTGEVMCIGRCLKCGREKEIPLSLIKKEVRNRERNKSSKN